MKRKNVVVTGFDAITKSLGPILVQALEQQGADAKLVEPGDTEAVQAAP